MKKHATKVTNRFFRTSKTILFFLLSCLTIPIAKCQTKTISGSVQGENGRLLHFVFIADNKFRTATFSDSLGNFSLPVHDESQVTFKMDGYRDTLIEAKSADQNMQILLRPSATLPVETIDISLRISQTSDGLAMINNLKPNAEGSRYISSSFSHGFFTDNSGKTFVSQYCLFDYEKISGYLLLTLDKVNVKEVAKDQVKSFTIFSKLDERFNFELVPEITKNHYCQLLASGSRYKLYKNTDTHFIPADAEMAHTASGDKGQDHDVYDDNIAYYLLDNQTKAFQKFTLKKKAIKSAFIKDPDKVNKFMAQNTSLIDEKYVLRLIEYLNS